MLEDAGQRPPRDWPRTAAALSGLFHGVPHGSRYRRFLAMPLAAAWQALHSYC